jgi:hypothetical protein
MKQIFIFVAILILRTVGTGLPRTLAIFARQPYILRRLSFGVVIGPYFFEDEAGKAVTANSARYTEMLRTFL